MGKKSRQAKENAAAGLSSFLLAQAEVKDDALADIFANSKGPSKAFAASSTSKSKKDKSSKKEKKSKKAIESFKLPTPPPQPTKSTSDDEDADEDADEGEVDDEILEPIEMDSDASLEMPSSDEDEDEDEDEDDDGLEQAYAAKMAAKKVIEEKGMGSRKRRKLAEAQGGGSEAEQSDEEEDEDEEEELIDADDLKHDTVLLKENKAEEVGDGKIKKSSKKDKRQKLNETSEQRDRRTIFLGNVPTNCSVSRPLKKSLIRHVLQSPELLALLPTDFPPLKCDSIRFRSIAFASTVFGRKPSQVDPESGEPIVEGGRGRKRAREWRDTESSDQRGVRGGFHSKEVEPTSSNVALKSGALTDGQKRRVALFRGDLNEGKKTCNAYLVLEPIPISSLPDEDLIKLIVEVVNGTTFEGFTLRADIVRPRSTAAIVAAAQIAAKPDANIEIPDSVHKGPVYTVPASEARRTVFIGGLDFAETEENVRSAVEAALVREKGSTGGAKAWVEGVRLIRDASSGLGKGFGYVLCQDPSCVDELLALPAGKFLKVSKRKVRLERCKTGIAAARAKASATVASKTASATATTNSKGKGKPLVSQAAAFAPKDPSLRKPVIAPHKLVEKSKVAEKQNRLAEALKVLPVEERKAIKSADPDRLARRAEKKRNKVLSERYERKMANDEKKGILGRESRGEVRRRQEKKRVQKGNKTGKRAKKVAT